MSGGGAGPGKTPAQRRVLDAIGCGNHAPMMAKATRDAMLRAGLIVELSPVRMGMVVIRQFDMPPHVHMDWCFSCNDALPPPPAGEAG